MTKFETIGVNRQYESTCTSDANKSFTRSCDVCCNKGIHLDCDRCSIAYVHSMVVAYFADEAKEKETKAIKAMFE